MIRRNKFPVTKILSLMIVLVVAAVFTTKGQKVYATLSRSQPNFANVTAFITTSSGSVTNPTAASDNNYNNYTTITAQSTVGVASIWTQLVFSSLIQANNIVYVRFDNPSNSLLAGDLTATTFNTGEANPIGSDGILVSSISSNITAASNTKFFKVVPNGASNAIRMTISSPAALGTNTSYIYYAFYIPSPVVSGKTICNGETTNLNVSSPNASLTYNWYASATSTDIIYTGTTYAAAPTSTTTYYVEAVETAPFVSGRTAVTVTVNSLPTLTVTQSATTIATGSSVTLGATHNGTSVKWYDKSGNLIASNASTTVGPFTTAGTFIYTAVSSNSTCSNSASISVAVFSSTDCPPLTEPVFANDQSWTNIVLGTVNNPTNANDGDTKTFSTLSSGVGLLGIGTVKQDLKWSVPVEKGTPVTIKLGNGSSVLALAKGLSVIGLKKIGTNYTEIGTAQPVDASLLNLLPGENVFEYTFVPSDGSGPQAYDGVRIVLASLLSVGQTTSVYEAYYYKPTNTIDCSKGDVRDVLFGAVDLGIGAATATVGVSNPLNAVDGSDASYANMFNSVGLLTYAKLQVLFTSPSIATDSLKIITSTGGSLLGVNLLNGFTIQRFLGGTMVGQPISSSSTFLSVQLLNGGTLAAITLLPMPEPYDRVEIRLGGVAGVLANLRIHEVQRKAKTKVESSDLNNAISVCQGVQVKLQAPADICTTFKWYDAMTGGNVVANNLTLNTNSLLGTKTYYIQPIRQGCEILKRGVVTVTVFPLPPHPTMQVNSH